ncbi:exonuclease domain-containing protein [Velocimicrobium porci]|uniref:BRCT domain-containing protein n=1 Tax=Velocimicrobium porci TaxID=2606634 RepID=A0A6L5Y040_9FIRM|nr:exonuclease domain-containing protein [Velocimicrobium porci]MSS64239.1 hypothetical protein [Velocimicrobium porci]
MIHPQSQKRYDFPNDYTVIDLEMTGLSLENDYIIELAGLKIKNNTIIDTFETLIKPPISNLSPHVISLTGITDTMLETAPSFSESISSFLLFLGDVPIVGHNVISDLSFLNKELNEANLPILTNDYIDTLTISRKLFPEFIHHKLLDMASYYEIDLSGAHRALTDCYITNSCFLKLKQTMLASFPTVKDYLFSFTNTGRRLKAESIFPSAEPNGNFPNDIWQKTFIFTGILKTMSRREAMLKVVNLGGLLSDKLNSSVDYLVAGIGEEEILVAEGGISRKLEKAIKLQQKGHPIKILSEEEFTILLNKNHNLQ